MDRFGNKDLIDFWNEAAERFREDGQTYHFKIVAEIAREEAERINDYDDDYFYDDDEEDFYEVCKYLRNNQ